MGDFCWNFKSFNLDTKLEKWVMQKVPIIFTIFLFLITAGTASAHQPRIIYFQQGDVYINNPENSQAFYDELKGESRSYFIESNKDFSLYINLLVPNPENRDAKYSANIFLLENNQEQQINFIDGEKYEWTEYYEESARDYYLKGPELDQDFKAGKYKIEVFNQGNQGKYILAVGKNEAYDAVSLLNVFWQLPLLKIQFFKSSPLEFFLTPFGIAGVGIIGAILVFLAIIYYLVGVIKETVKHNQAKTLLLTSAGMQMKDEIIKLLQKPTYDITVAFISTASKPQENQDYVKKDLNIMRVELRFNVEEIDIEGKKEKEVMELLELKDIIFVEGGNTFYLLKAMRACNFEKIIRKLLKQGKVYIGASAGSIVAGKTIRTANKFGTGDNGNMVRLKSLKGLNLVPFDVFVHYQPEHAELIRKKRRWKWQRRKLRILTDDQAILVQGKETVLIGKGNKIVI